MDQRERTAFARQAELVEQIEILEHLEYRKRIEYLHRLELVKRMQMLNRLELMESVSQNGDSCGKMNRNDEITDCKQAVTK